MSRIGELCDKYLTADFRDLGNRQLTELREELRSTTVAEISTLEQHKQYIELLQLFRKAVAENDKLHGDNYAMLLESLLSVGEDGLYSNNLRFIFELIQNVDDCEYADWSDAQLSMQFDPQAGKIVMDYNEKGFTPFNVFAITGIAEAAKNISAEKIEIGEKGIGFKSVFGVAEKVLIQSGGFSFELYKNNFTIPIPCYSEFQSIQGTRLTLYVSADRVQEIYRILVDEYCRRDALLNKNPLLFLNKLTKLRLFIDGARSLSFSVSRNSAPSITEMTVEEKVHIEADLQDYYHCVDKSFHAEISAIRYIMPVAYNREMCVSRYGKQTAFREKKMFMQVVIPMPEMLYTDDSMKQGMLYSFMPTQIQMNAPFVCHIPFKLDGSREYVDPQKNNTWFLHSCKSFSEMMGKVYLDLAQKVKHHIVNYLPPRDKGLFKIDNGKTNCLNRDEFQGEQYLKLEIFYTVDNHFKSVKDIFRFSSNEEIIEPEKIYRLLGEKEELFVFPEQAKERRVGIRVLNRAAKKLFRRALTTPEVTKAALDILKRTSEFSFKENKEEISRKQFTIGQIEAFSSCRQLMSVFYENMSEELRNQRNPDFRVDIDSVEMKDVRNIDPSGEPLDISDFDPNAERYLNSINFRYATLVNENVDERFYFAARNILVLSGKNPMRAFSEFCRNADDDCTLSATLTFRDLSKQLNDVENTMKNSEYLRKLRQIRNSIRQAFGKGVYDNYIRIINDAGANPDRFINELLQNADDCEYPENEIPSFELDLTIDRTLLQTKYNESGFTKQNVRAITAIGESTKKKLLSRRDGQYIEIGEKGIGFKSVFAVAKDVEIHSGDFHFQLKGEQPTVPIPINKDAKPIVGTMMRFALKKALRKDFFTEETVLRLCLCLRKLRIIRLGDFEVHINEEDGIRTVTVNGKEYEYIIETYKFLVDNESLIRERANYTRHISKEQKIVCYLPKGVQSVNARYYLYSGLPTLVEINIPMIIDAPFELTTSRDELMENGWNTFIRREVYQALYQILENYKYTYGIDILEFIHIKYEGISYLNNMFSSEWLNHFDLLGGLKKKQFIQTYKAFVFGAPADNLQRPPRVIGYLLEQNANIELSKKKIVKTKSQKYNMTLNALGVRELSCSLVIKILEKVYQDLIGDEEFRKQMYEYLKQDSKEINELRSHFRTMKIIPVKGQKPGDITFVQWEGNQIYYKTGSSTSIDGLYIMDQSLLSKQDCEKILNINLSELNSAVEEKFYRDQLFKRINESIRDELLYQYLLTEYTKNRVKMISCRDMLQVNRDKIPLKTEDGTFRRGSVLLSNEDSGYYAGPVFLSHIAHNECKSFAEFINCKSIKDVIYDDLTIQDNLTEDDIEDLQTDSVRNGTDIIGRCLREGKISDALIEQYNLFGFVSTQLDRNDFDFPDEPLQNPHSMKAHIQKLLAQKIRIEKRKESRLVAYGVPVRGKPFQLSGTEARNAAIRRYTPAGTMEYCFCQMCKNVKHHRYVEVNNIEANPKYYWKELRIVLCLECSKHFEEIRQNKQEWEKFYRALMQIDPNQRAPVDVSIANETITFTQTHLAEIQGIMQGK